MLYYVDERTYFDKQDHYYGACPEGFRHFLESIFWENHSYCHVFMIFNYNYLPRFPATHPTISQNAKL